MFKKIIISLVALGLIALTIIKLKDNKENAEKRVFQYDKEKPVSIHAVKVDFGQSEEQYIYSGTFEPVKESKISADIQGRIDRVLTDPGRFVQKGQTLIQLDNALLGLQLQSIEVQIEGLETDVARYTILAKADAVQGVQLEKVQLGLKAAKVQRATIQEQISKTTIRAPFSGFVTAKLTEEGGFAAPGIPIIQITDISNLKFTVNVPEDRLNLFHQGQTCSISADVYPELSLTGEVIMIGAKANSGNSYPVQLAVKNTDDSKVKAGMFGKLTIKSDSDQRNLVIPASAMVGTSLQPKVYLVKNGRVRLQSIEISRRLEDKVMVSRGISEGDMIVTAGFINLSDGARVILK